MHIHACTCIGCISARCAGHGYLKKYIALKSVTLSGLGMRLGSEPNPQILHLATIKYWNYIVSFPVHVPCHAEGMRQLLKKVFSSWGGGGGGGGGGGVAASLPPCPNFISQWWRNWGVILPNLPIFFHHYEWVWKQAQVQGFIKDA